MDGDGRSRRWTIDTGALQFVRLTLLFITPTGTGGGFALDSFSPREICP